MKNTIPLISAVLSLSAAAGVRADQEPPAVADKAAFDQATAGAWREVLTDPGTGDWKQRWFVDGEVGTVKTGPEGMELSAGPEFKNNAHHMVLWTKRSFVGDLKIEFEYTRLDEEARCVTILYIQATGSGKGRYDEDITKWNDLRKVPAMDTYYDHMNTYHISYAAFPGATEGTSYIRARRYLPERSGIKGTDLKPDYFPSGLFKKGVPHKITVIKNARDLFMRVANAEQTYFCHMPNPDLPEIAKGRIGLRHMFTRSARYRDFRVSTTNPEPDEGVGRPTTGRYADHEELVADTYGASLKLRERALRKTIARDSCWPAGAWGDTLWALAALQLNEKTEDANARLLRRARDYIALNRRGDAGFIFLPEKSGDTPWTYFALTDYVRILYLFHGKSPHFPGRLHRETEVAMKQALWLWVSRDSRIADAGPDDLFLLLGTENHDLTKRPSHYLITSLLKEDPAYRDRPLADGHTTAEHAAAYTAFFREWPRSRAGSGLWVELGSNTYQKYSWPALFNLLELAPDPLIRHRFKNLLDLAFIEEAQISVRGRRGGGRSRGNYDRNAFESYKNLLYAPGGQPAGSSHSRVIEASRYQLPAAAILLRTRAFPTAEPLVIRNRVLGELEADRPEDPVGSQRLAADPALVNYAYRTSHYLLGSTLQNPALTMRDPETGAPTLKYAGISRQKRACGILFDDPASGEICAVSAEIARGSGGRPQHSCWSVQHENVLILQRIAPLGRSTLGSYSTDAVGIGFEGKALKQVEEGGWIFASNGKAFVGVKFLDGPYQWDEKRVLATPANFNRVTDQSRILLHAGDIAGHGSFDQFKEDLLASRLNVTPDKVDYQFGPAPNHLEVTRYDAKTPDRFTLPVINGKPVDLRPAKAYQSPYLNGNFGSDKISVTVGPIKRVMDFSK